MRFRCSWRLGSAVAILCLVGTVCIGTTNAVAQDPKANTEEWQQGILLYCISLPLARDVWNAHKEGGFKEGWLLFQQYKEEYENYSPKCRKTERPVRFQIVRIVDEAVLEWFALGEQTSYLVEIHIIGSPTNRFAFLTEVPADLVVPGPDV